MADKKISELATESPLTGTELVELVTGGVNKKTTTQDIADLASPSGGGHVIEDEGTPLTQRTKLNFVGAGVTVTDDSVDDASVVTIPSATAILATTISNGDTTHAPDGNSVFDALALKLSAENSAVVLTDAGTIDLTAIKHTLASSAASRTFTISYTGDFITMEVTLSTTTATYTFPATALCTSEGSASGNNTLPLLGVSGDKYIIIVNKIGSAYYVVAKNFGQ